MRRKSRVTMATETPTFSVCRRSASAVWSSSTSHNPTHCTLSVASAAMRSLRPWPPQPISAMRMWSLAPSTEEGANFGLESDRGPAALRVDPKPAARPAILTNVRRSDTDTPSVAAAISGSASPPARIQPRSFIFSFEIPVYRRPARARPVISWRRIRFSERAAP